MISKKLLPTFIIMLLTAAVLCSCTKQSGDKLVSRGVKLYEQQDYSAALDAFMQAEELGLDRQTDDVLYFHMGQTYYKLGEYEKSIAAHRKVLAIRPEAFKSRVTIGVCYSKLGKKKEALEAYSSALLYDPQNADSVGLYVSLGALYISNNKPYTAMNYLEKAEQIYPEQPAAHAYLAIAYTMAYEYEKADSELALAEQYGYGDINGVKEQMNKVRERQNN
ncbi:MAG: tetratricopeptide repeat protein [Oscillospiraceae bacterium]